MINLKQSQPRNTVLNESSLLLFSFNQSSPLHFSSTTTLPTTGSKSFLDLILFRKIKILKIILEKNHSDARNAKKTTRCKDYET